VCITRNLPSGGDIILHANAHTHTQLRNSKLNWCGGEQSARPKDHTKSQICDPTVVSNWFGIDWPYHSYCIILINIISSSSSSSSSYHIISIIIIIIILINFIIFVVIDFIQKLTIYTNTKVCTRKSWLLPTSDASAVRLN